MNATSTAAPSEILDLQIKRPIAWLLRSWRFHRGGGNPEISDGIHNSITGALQRHGFNDVRLSRLETLDADNRLTDTKLRIVASELKLGEDVVDLFYYLQGNRGRFAPSSARSDTDRLWHLVRWQSVEKVHHWPAIARAFNAAPPAFSRNRDDVARSLFDDIKKFKGRSFYALRNTAILLQSHIAPVAIEELGYDAVRGYHLVEPLGLMRDRNAITRLLQIVKDDFNTWTSGAVLEALRRSRVATVRLTEKDHRPELRALVLEYLASDNYATQHQAALLGLQSFPHDKTIFLRIKLHHNFDVTNILTSPAGLPRELRAIVEDIDRHIEAEVVEEPTSKGMRAELIQQAIFGESRIDRSEAAWALSLSPFQDALVTATMQTLIRNSSLEEEHQRNLVRLIGRVGGEQAPGKLQRIAITVNVHESVRIASLWDLPGMITAPQPWLTTMLAHERSDKVAAAIVTVGGKIGDIDFLRVAEQDGRPTIRREAQSWM